MSSGRGCHIFVDNLANAECRQIDIRLQQLCNTLLNGLTRPFQVQREGKFLRVNPAERDISIGDRWLASASIVSCGSRFRSRTFGTHLDAFEFIDPGDATATGTDLDHLDNRDPHRQAATFFKTVNTINFKTSRGKRFAIIDQAQLCGGSAHIERQHSIEPKVL